MLELCVQQSTVRVNLIHCVWPVTNCAFLVGEVYVLNDGGEVDLDLGNYERYLNITLSKDNNITTGKIYRHVIDREVSHRNIVSL